MERKIILIREGRKSSKSFLNLDNGYWKKNWLNRHFYWDGAEYFTFDWFVDKNIKNRDRYLTYSDGTIEYQKETFWSEIQRLFSLLMVNIRLLIKHGKTYNQVMDSEWVLVEKENENEK